MALTLQAAGAHVRPPAAAHQAWAANCERAPDNVVSDLGMPGEDGYSLMKRIRKRGGGAAVPAIALTGFTRPVDKARVHAAGFAAHVAKPVDPELLVAVLSKLLADRPADERY
jgi:CheY-like chemotaxis protein